MGNWIWKLVATIINGKQVSLATCGWIHIHTHFTCLTLCCILVTIVTITFFQVLALLNCVPLFWIYYTLKYLSGYFKTNQGVASITHLFRVLLGVADWKCQLGDTANLRFFPIHLLKLDKFYALLFSSDILLHIMRVCNTILPFISILQVKIPVGHYSDQSV